MQNTKNIIFERLGIRPEEYCDLHITRNFSSFVAVSQGIIIGMTEPIMKHCPLFSILYKEDQPADIQEIKRTIERAVNEKIERFGSFTPRREVIRDDIAVPFGASEMMMYALRKKSIDAAVTVCDGAGTVISSSPSLVQGIGARMNGLFYTTPVPNVIKKIGKEGGTVVFPDTARIDQIAGLEKAAELGFKNIAVTINGFSPEPFHRLSSIENKYNIHSVCITVCTTGISKEEAERTVAHSDLVWSCGSGPVREIAGRTAIIQITSAIPVFVLTVKGLDFASAYASEPRIIKNLSPDKQYLIAGNVRGIDVTMGTYSTHLTESKLPVRSNKEPG